MVTYIPNGHKMTTVITLGDGTTQMVAGMAENGKYAAYIYHTNIPQEIGYSEDCEASMPEDVNLNYPDVILAIEDVKGLDVFIQLLTAIKKDMEEGNEC